MLLHEADIRREVGRPVPVYRDKQTSSVGRHFSNVP
jgi:hypothetical protein